MNASQDAAPAGLAVVEPVPRHTDRKSAEWPTLRLWAGLTLALAGMALIHWPQAMRWVWYAFGDLGCNLTLSSLVSSGAKPLVDFGYLYGLLPAFVGDLGMRAFGRTPLTYALMALFAVFLTVGATARFVTAAGAGRAGVAFLFANFINAVQYLPPHFCHALEPLLLIMAFAEHARGRRPAALAFLTAACFTKPTLAYLYGAMLVVLMARDLISRRAGAAEWARALAPAAATALTLAGLFALVYGPESVARSLLPTAGAALYRHYKFGFFSGVGRQFWHPSGKSAGYYLGTVAGTWILSSFVLLAAGIASGVRWAMGRGDAESHRRDEIVLTCAGFHAAFVVLAFGHNMTWAYYYYALVLGVVAATAAWRPAAWAAWVLVPLALLGSRAYLLDCVTDWQTLRPTALTAGLWATDREREEWARVRALTAGRPTVVLTHQGGGAEAIFPEFGKAESWSYARGLSNDAEIARKVARIGASDAVIMTNFIIPADQFLDLFPEFRKALAAFAPTAVGEDLVVYLRR